MENKTARFDLTLLMEEHEQGHRGSLEYNSHLFDEDSIRQMMEDFQALLTSIVDNPEQHIRELPLLTEAPLQVGQTDAEATAPDPAERGSHFRIIHGYTKNEQGKWAVVYDMPASNLQNSDPSARKALENIDIYLLDQYMQPVPRGVVGEIYIGGTDIKDAPLDHAAAVSNTLATRNGYLYKTGDFARYLSNGNLVFLGRSHERITIGSIQVWLSEVTDVLRTLPEIHDAVVLAQENRTGETQLVAYVVPVQELKAQLTLKDLRSSMSELAPNYMVPAAFVLLDQLPLTPDGEIDQTALPAIDEEASISAATGSPPRSQLEKDIAESWREVLKIEEVGIHDNFFDRGGHSLLLIRLHSSLQARLHLDITILDLFKYPTISSLAQYIQQKQIDLPSQKEVQDIHKRTDRYKAAMQTQKALVKERRKNHGTN